MAGFAWGDRLPTIAGARVVLRALESSDVPDLFGIFSDSEVLRFWDGTSMTSITDADAYLRQIDENFRSRQLFQWGIAHQATGSILGTCTLLHVNLAHRRGEIGFALGRPHWGKGLARDAVAALIAFAFEHLDLHRLEADVDPRNDRSLRLLEGLGFQREGYLRERYHLKGGLQDTVLLGLLRSEWKAVAGFASLGR